MAKLEGHLDNHPAWLFYKAVRVFDPRQVTLLPTRNIANYQVAIKALREPTPTLIDEWEIYTHIPVSEIDINLSIADYWEAVAQRFPDLSKVATDCMWMPVSSVDVERSF